MELHDTRLLWVFTAGVFFVAGVVKGVVGLGLPTVSVALLGLVMPPLEAAALLIIPSLVTNLRQMAGPGLGKLAWRFRTMLAGIFLGTLATGSIMAGNAEVQGRQFLGLMLVLYGLFGLVAPELRIAPALERWLSLPVGAVTGAISALTGVFVIPVVPYLQGLAMDRDALIQALGLVFTASTIALALMLGAGRAIDGAAVGLSVFALFPAMAGMAAGQRIRRRLSVAAFRRCLFVGLLVLGLYLGLQSS